MKAKPAPQASTPAESRNLNPMVYMFVARDSDMIVYENHMEKQVQSAMFQAEVFEILNSYQDIDDIE